MTDALTPRLKTRYQTEIKDALQKLSLIHI